MALLVCPDCRGTLTDGLRCGSCRRRFSTDNGIPVLLPSRPTSLEREYRDNYDEIAADDLETPIVGNRFELLHRDLVEFIGDTTGQSVLDIGSAYGSYLTVMPARERVAVDLAVAYLRTIAEGHGVTRIVGDAERLPVDPSRFDVVILADVIEHLLHPDRCIDLLRGSGARIVVHVPWQEDIAIYDNSKYQFVHLRSLNDETMADLFTGFTEVRRRVFQADSIWFAMFEYV